MTVLTDCVLARRPASLSQMSAACVSIVPRVTSISALNFVTSASYPNVRIRALGRSAERMLCGQRTPFFVHVVLRFPNNPWTNTMLQVIGQKPTNVRCRRGLLNTHFIRHMEFFKTVCRHSGKWLADCH